MDFLLKIIYNKEVTLIYLGAILSLILVVLVNYIKSRWKYEVLKEGLEKEIEEDSNKFYVYGDIEQYLKINKKVEPLNIKKEFVSNSIQPLLVVLLINLFEDKVLSLEIFVTISVILFSFFHETIGAPKEWKKWMYRVIVIIFWVSSYGLITFRHNTISIHEKSNMNTSNFEEKKCKENYERKN